MSLEISPPDPAISRRNFTRHQIKAHPEPFEAMWLNRKPFEVRWDDRDYRAGDRLWVVEFCPRTETYSGRGISCWITCVLTGEEWGLMPGYATLGLGGIRQSRGQVLG